MEVYNNTCNAVTLLLCHIRISVRAVRLNYCRHKLSIRWFESTNMLYCERENESERVNLTSHNGGTEASKRRTEDPICGD